MQKPDHCSSPPADLSLGMAVNRVDRHISKSPGKKSAAVKELAFKVKHISERRRQPVKRIIEEIKNTVAEFYNKDDVSRWKARICYHKNKVRRKRKAAEMLLANDL